MTGMGFQSAHWLSWSRGGQHGSSSFAISPYRGAAFQIDFFRKLLKHFFLRALPSPVGDGLRVSFASFLRKSRLPPFIPATPVKPITYGAAAAPHHYQPQP
jgi:hypothetical protein